MDFYSFPEPVEILTLDDDRDFDRELDAEDYAQAEADDWYSQRQEEGE